MEDGGRRTEDGGRRTEDRGRRTEDGGRRTGDGGRGTEDGGRRTEDGGRRTGDGGRGTEDGELRTDMGEPIQSFKELRVYQLACDPHALAWTSCRLCSEGRGDEREIREVGPEVASVGGGQAVGLHGGVGGNQEIGDEMLAWSAFAPIAEEGLACEVGGLWRDGVEVDLDRLELLQGGFGGGKTGGTLGKNDGINEKRAFGGGLGERMAPPFPAGLASLQENHHRRIKRGSHGSFGLEGSSTGPRSSSRTVSAPTIGQGSCHCSPKCSHASGEIVFVAFRKGAFSSNSKTSPGFR